MRENSEKNLQEMFDGDLSVDDEQLNSIAEDDSLLDSNGDIVSGQRSPLPGRYNQKRTDTTTRTYAAASSKAEQAEPAKENSLPTNPHSKQGEEFKEEALLENIHAAPPPIAMKSLEWKTK